MELVSLNTLIVSYHKTLDITEYYFDSNLAVELPLHFTILSLTDQHMIAVSCLECEFFDRPPGSKSLLIQHDIFFNQVYPKKYSLPLHPYEGSPARMRRS